MSRKSAILTPPCRILKLFTFIAMKKSLWRYYLLVASIVLLDQSFKLWVYYNMEMGYRGTVELLGSWLKLCYTLNPGMAYGIQLGSKYGKLLLTLGRILAICVISSHLWLLGQKEHKSARQLYGWSLILGGAVGNVIDSIFYAALLDLAPPSAPMAWFHGPVIDMIFLHIVDIKIPTWFPFIGGSYWGIFPVCNLADLAIILGIVAILWVRLCQSRRHKTTASTKDNFTLSPSAE